MKSLELMTRNVNEMKSARNVHLSVLSYSECCTSLNGAKCGPKWPKTKFLRWRSRASVKRADKVRAKKLIKFSAVKSSKVHKKVVKLSTYPKFALDFGNLKSSQL